MLETNRIDLAIPANQNKLVITLAEYFSAKELEEINHSVRNIKCIASDTAHEACHGMETIVDFDDASFCIQCKLDDNVMPPIHHISINMKKEDKYETIINCNPDIRNPIYLCRVVARAINFINYKDINDGKYNRRSVLENVSKALSDIVDDIDCLIHFRGRIATEIYNNSEYKKHGFHYETDYNEKYFLYISGQFGSVIDIYIKTKDDTLIWYVPQTDIGINLLLLALDKAIIILKTKLYVE